MVDLPKNETNFLPLLAHAKGQMLSRNYLRKFGITDEMITLREARGEVIVCMAGTENGSAWDSVVITHEGLDAIGLAPPISK